MTFTVILTNNCPGHSLLSLLVLYGGDIWLFDIIIFMSQSPDECVNLLMYDHMHAACFLSPIFATSHHTTHQLSLSVYLTFTVLGYINRLILTNWMMSNVSVNSFHLIWIPIYSHCKYFNPMRVRTCIDIGRCRQKSMSHTEKVHTTHPSRSIHQIVAPINLWNVIVAAK